MVDGNWIDVGGSRTASFRGLGSHFLGIHWDRRVGRHSHSMETRQIGGRKMLTWLTLKTFLKKAWAFIKKYWQYFIAIFYGMGVWLYFSDSAKKSKEILETTRESYEKQIKAINDAHKQEVEKRDLVIKKYNEIIKMIEEEYTKKRKFLELAEKREVKKMIEEYADDPKSLAKLMSEKFGITYVGE